MRNLMPISLSRLARDQRAISLVEFALMLPLFLGIIFAGLELSQYTLAVQRMQRVTANVADLVAQSGTASIGATESQINDILDSLNYMSQPFDVTANGRMIVTAAQGQKDPLDSNKVKNRKLWHRCTGTLTGDPNKIPGAIGSVVVLPRNRALLDGEIMILAQVSYQYQPLSNISIGNLWNPNNRTITRVAVFRPRSKTFVSITPDGTAAKSTCPTT